MEKIFHSNTYTYRKNKEGGVVKLSDRKLSRLDYVINIGLKR